MHSTKGRAGFTSDVCEVKGSQIPKADTIGTIFEQTKLLFWYICRKQKAPSIDESSSVVDKYSECF